MSGNNYDAKLALNSHNTTVVECAVDLASTMVRQVLGKAVSKSVSGSVIKDSALTSLCATHIKNELKV